jgi:hypothetical protein
VDDEPGVISPPLQHLREETFDGSAPTVEGSVRPSAEA